MKQDNKTNTKSLAFHIVTIFPEIFNSYFNESILKRAQETGKIEIKVYNLRDFSENKHKKVDDTPYGGGPGMVLMVEPIYRCLEHIKCEIKKKEKKNSGLPASRVSVVLTSAKGKQYTQAHAEKLKQLTDVIIICGRYEGVDERVAKHLVDEEFSIGKYVLTGGEIPAMVIVDSVSRLLEGVLGNRDSLGDSKLELECSDENSKFENEHPVFTKPEKFQDWKVPGVLLSGNHKEIEQWRKSKRNKTKE